MKTRNITLYELKEYAKSINGTEVETKAQHKMFLFTVDERGFHYVPGSTSKPRIQQYEYIERVLEKFNECRSLSPVDYRDITMNASYLLAVIEEYINLHDKVE